MTSTAKTPSPSRLDAALEYIGRGWSVLPLHQPSKGGRCSCGSKTCANVGKHPRVRGGVHAATTDPAKVEDWWKRHPEANIGIATGAASGLVVLDIDPRHGGEKSLDALVARHGPLPDTVESITGGGGRHIYFRHPGPGCSLANDLGRDLPGVEVKGDGCYIVAPPSLHQSGRTYEWEASSEPGGVDIAPLPGWLLALITKPDRPQANCEPEPPIREGQRNAHLTSVAGTMRKRGLGEEAIRAALLADNAERCEPPLDEREVEKIVRSVMRYAPAEASGQNLPSRVALPSLPLACSPRLDGVNPLAFNWTDSGNAELLSALFGDSLQYDHRRGRWLLWGGHVWQEPTTGELVVLAKFAARFRYGAASDAGNEDQRKWAFGSESRARIDNALHLGRSEPRIANDGSGWDTDPYLLGASNGLVDLRTGELRTGRRDDRVTMRVRAPFDPNACAPRWEAFVQEVFDGDQELIAFVHRAVGHSLTGDVREQCFFMCYGKGMNGKSVMLNTVRYLLGDYAGDTPFSTLELSARSSIPAELASILGKRFVTALETSDTARLNEARIKLLTGGDAVTCRQLYKPLFTYEPTYKFWLACNHKPVVHDDSEGFWRRVMMVPFTRHFGGGREDRRLAEKLRNEGAGILAWCVRGALAWAEQGLAPPDQVRAATQEFRVEADPLGAFVEDCCAIGPEQTAKAAELHQAYTQWCDRSGIRLRERLNETQFGRRMSDRFEKTRTKAGRVYKGIGVRDQQDDRGDL
jgi:putative DNA primase/helicase